ncbi:hypothetical protein DFH07DRAFT_770767 [Mycena maculata]|uniref:Uncharacterized protein n=1 Tax=Mycena maculata TaxID=230809 RepID=A0AAD7JHN4_9AGAR|nr:hypothetical protein DFH07DRAFT_770767 [Mycena maculata]
MALVFLFLNLPTPAGSFTTKVMKIDLVYASIVLTMRGFLREGSQWKYPSCGLNHICGVQYPWSSARILATLILGCIGLLVFVWYEFTIANNPITTCPYTSKHARTQLRSPDIFRPVTDLSLKWENVHRETGRSEFEISLEAINGWTSFKCVRKQCRSPTDWSPVYDIFGLAFSVAPSALLVGLSIAKSHQYRPQIWLSWTLAIIGTGLFPTLDVDSPRAKAIGFQVIAGCGLGMMTAAIFSPILAPLPVESSNGAVHFLPQIFERQYFHKSFTESGNDHQRIQIFVVAVGGTVLQNELGKHLPPDFVDQFRQGTAVAYSIIPLIRTLPEPFKTQTRVAFAESLQTIWQVLIGVSTAGLLVSLATRRFPLYTEVDKKWGIDQKGEVEKGSMSLKSLPQQTP